MKLTCKTLISLFALSSLFVSVESAAQTAETVVQHEFKFRTLSPSGGLSYDGVMDVEQDGAGFVWVLLGNDLIRFDGYEYRRYYSHFSGEGASSRLNFYSLVADSYGRLHVSCAQGLFRYDHSADSFEKLLDRAYFIFADERNNIWVRQDGRFGILRGVDSLDVKVNDTSSIREIYAVESSEDGGLFVASYFGQIFRYDYSCEEFSSFYTFPAAHYILKIHRAGDKLWVLLRNHGLALLDIPSRTLTAMYEFPSMYEGTTVRIHDMQVDKNGRIWIATQQGVWFFDPETMERHLYRHSDNDIFSLPHNSVWVVTSDRKDNIWLGTYGGRLCMVDPDERKDFTTYFSLPGYLNHNTVSAFAEDNQSLWIGTEGGGVNRLDKSTGKFYYFVPEIPGVDTPRYGNHIKSLVRDDKNRLWIATYLGGMMSYDLRSGEFRYFSNRGQEKARLLVNDLRKILPEGDRGLWISYQSQRHAVSFLPYDGSGIRHYYFDTESTQRYVWDICLSREAMWMITPQNLYRMDVATHDVLDVSSSHIPFLNAQSLCVDSGGNVWIGTVSGTVLRYDPASEEFTTIDGLSGYNAAAVQSLCFDDDGHLWMGTDNGLFRYTPETGKFLKFDSTDGTQGNMYYPLSSMASASGNLIFGGTNGFTIVSPRAVSESVHIPKAIISGFTINNVPATPRYGDRSPSTWYGRDIVLSYRETGFGFRLASDNYTSASKTRYRYLLAGYDPVPVTVDATGRAVTYSNVPAGTYRFEVSASVDGESWGEPLYVTVVRRPAPWNSWAAWALYAAVLLTIAATITYYWLEKRRLAMQVYLDGVEKQKQDELHQSQLRFFTNISHDFRTPLSLILGAVDNLGHRGSDDKYYRIVNSNSQRLLGLVNELMDFRTVENGMMRLQVQPVDVNRLMAGIAGDFADHARRNEIDFRVEFDERLSCLVPADRSVVEKIVMNLLNNAFKYTPRGGLITISTHAPGDDFCNRYDTSHRISAGVDSGSYFTIAVSDTGVGISKESISKVFERFYKVNTAGTDLHLGTGIGLALVKSLVLLHRGAITIFSERDHGTDMVVELPATFEAYPACEIAANDALDGGSRTPPPVTPDEGASLTQTAAESMLMRTQRRVLVVEDNDELREMIADFLSSEYDVVQVADGEIASEWLAANEADMIVSDIMMPRKDGVELCREVKENVSTSHIPFVLLTAKTDIASKLAGTGSGADLYFEKPVDLKLLALALGNIFNRQSALREHYSKNYFVESSELSQNEHDNAFLKKLIDTIDRNLTEPIIDVNFIASEMSMSRRKLYSKVKALTDKSIVEFILNYRMRKAARLIIEDDLSMRQVMERVGIKSQAYFTNAFKKEFNQTPSAFAKSNSKRPLL